MEPRRRRRRFFPLLVLTVGLALLGAAAGLTLMTQPAVAGTPNGSVASLSANVGVVASSDSNQSTQARPAIEDDVAAFDTSVQSGQVEVTSPEVNAPMVPVQSEPKDLATRPERIRIPRLEVDAPVVPVATSSSGSLNVPSDPQVLGWWADGAQPGAQRGTSILAGHVNTAASGPGALSNLIALRPGDEIIVEGSGRTLRLRVVDLVQYPKSELPASAAFSQEVEGRLAIVSCGGPFNPSSGHYRDNIIAYAEPVATGAGPSSNGGL